MNNSGEATAVREPGHDERIRWEQLASRERTRLVRLCAQLSGSTDAAKDLAQDTLIEAWKHREKLHDWSGDRQWLSQIARYVCLRWRRRHGREAGLVERERARGSEDSRVLEDIVADEFDMAVELERSELADLLDRAMDLASAGVRELLTRHYVEGLRQSELADLLNTTEGAVAVRLHRGKIVLRRILLTDLQVEAATYGLVKLGAGTWQETDAWCTMCGASHLHARWSSTPAPGWLTLRCPLCYRADGVTFHDAALAHSLPAEVAYAAASYRSLVHHIGRWIHGFYRPTLGELHVSCPDCGRRVPLHLRLPDDLPAQLGGKRGLHFSCAVCNRSTIQGFEGLSAAPPEVQAFAGEHPRYRTLPERRVEAEGQPAVVTGFESIPDGSRLDVVSARESYRVLGIYGRPARTHRSTH